MSWPSVRATQSRTGAGLRLDGSLEVPLPVPGAPDDQDTVPVVCEKSAWLRRGEGCSMHGLFLHGRHRPPHGRGTTEESYCPGESSAPIAVDHR